MLTFLCSDDERRRAADMTNADRRARYVIRKGLLRVLLADYAQRAVRTQEALASSAYTEGVALFALARTRRLGLGIAPVRPNTSLPVGALTAEQALWVSRSPNRARATALFVAAREACGRAECELRDVPLLRAVTTLEKDPGPVPIDGSGLVMQLVRDRDVVGCVVHDGAPLPCRVRALGG
jgi:hypothetical protein